MGSRTARHCAAAVGAVVALAGIGSAQATLNVNNLNSHGTLGDSVLSLDEAMQLATGDIGLPNLSRREKIQVACVPGVTVSDVIVFDFLVVPATITTQADLTLLAGLDAIDCPVNSYHIGNIVRDALLTRHPIRITGANATILYLDVDTSIGPGVLLTSLLKGNYLGALIKDRLLTGGYHRFGVDGTESIVDGDSTDSIVFENVVGVVFEFDVA